MKKLFKILFSVACFALIVGCTVICIYEVYNSFLSSDPRNIEVYHQMADKSDFFATSGIATNDTATPEEATTDVATPEIATEDSSFSVPELEEAEISTEDDSDSSEIFEYNEFD